MTQHLRLQQWLNSIKMADISQIPNFQLKVIFLIHTLFFSLATTGYWAPTGYSFYNILIIILILHIILSDNTETLKIALVLNGVSFVLDLFMVGFHFHSSSMFSCIIAIIFTLVKPATTFVLFKISQERGDAPGGSERNIGNIFTTNRDSYEDIDRNVPSVAAHPSQGGYNISTAQQI
ncbi:uncharacterized protein [Onthophagus taurus]|uniref:uncharacterized protein n=1 Tax=Onthophagus taurus TaxID=166361 RepID=UPI000C20EE42|nr:uncharacterized protein LOC111426730 [Onthophagus taurus]